MRPEHPLPVATGSGLLKGEAKLAEQLGGETYLCVALAGEGNVTVEIKGQAEARAGETMELGFDAGKLHVVGSDEKVLRHA